MHFKAYFKIVLVYIDKKEHKINKPRNQKFMLYFTCTKTKKKTIPWTQNKRGRVATCEDKLMKKTQRKYKLKQNVEEKMLKKLETIGRFVHTSSTCFSFF